MTKTRLIFSTGRCEGILSRTQKSLIRKCSARAIELAKIADCGITDYGIADCGSADCGSAGRGAIALSLATKNQISELKKKFWGVKRPTDVISFRYPGTGGGGIFADIIICPELARERAAEYGNSFIFELLLYAVHGVLHIAGKDDSTQKKREKMSKEEDRIMKILSAEFTGLAKKTTRSIYMRRTRKNPRNKRNIRLE